MRARSSRCRSTRSSSSGESERVADFRCTYRVQLAPELGFRRVRELVLPYLRDLGVSHLYLSPVLTARSGSTHGYDVVDPTRVSGELGGEEELRALCEAAHAGGLGTVLDVVPNHMAASEEENRFWRDPELRARAFDWEDADGELLEFARRVIALRREHPVFRRTSFLTGRAGESGLPDAWWFRADGRRMTQRDWTSPETQTLGVFLNGREIHERTPRGEPLFDDSFLVIFNAHSEPVVFTLPTRRFGSRWQVELATGEAPDDPLEARALVAVQEHSLMLLRRV